MVFLLEKIHLISDRKKRCPVRPGAERFVRAAAAVLRRGNLCRIVVRSEGSVVLDTSVTAAVLAAFVSLRLTFLGIVAVLLSPWEVEIKKPEDLRA